jgi:hypothetical protein
VDATNGVARRQEEDMKYLLAFFGEEGGWDDLSPEEMQEGMKLWGQYEQDLLDSGAYVSGEGLQPSATATTVKREGENRTVTDGPFAETKEQLGGFYLIDVADLDEALEWAKKVPVSDGQSTEVRPVMDYSQFGYESPAEAAKAAS